MERFQTIIGHGCPLTTGCLYDDVEVILKWMLGKDIRHFVRWLLQLVAESGAKLRNAIKEGGRWLDEYRVVELQ
jgi:hypothetical protein